MEFSRISKIAGLGLAGFIVVAGAADRVNLNPMAAQIAGFAGAFIGTLVAHRRKPAAPPPAEVQQANAGAAVAEPESKVRPDEQEAAK